MSFRMLYHNIKIILLTVFFGMQVISVSHAIDSHEHPHQDCIVCDAGVLSVEPVNITPKPYEVPFPFLTEKVPYVSTYQSAATKSYITRGPPPRAPPLT